MAEETSGQEKTEQPTEKRRDDARKKGEVPRSRELNTVISLLAAGMGLAAFGASLGQGLIDQFTAGLTVRGDELSGTEGMLQAASAATTDMLLVLAPFFVIMLLSVFVGPLAMGGLVMNPASAAPKLEKLDPIKGLGRIFSMNGLMELIKAMGKFGLVGFVAWTFLSWSINDVVRISLEPVGQAIGHTVYLIVICVIATSAVLVLVASLDVPFQLFQFNKKLRMTRQEIKDELKETEGRPEVKGRIRRLQQEASQRRMMQDVAEADVVIRNPTHFAVALKYKGDDMRAPVVVARGRDLIALEIIARAEEHGVFVFSAPPLARAIYASTDIGHEIPAALYVAVAQVLAYVFHVRRGDTDSVSPPSDFDIPTELQDKF